MMNLSFDGIVVGAGTFAIIAISRYSCIIAEYHFGKQFWVVFLLGGIVLAASSLLISNLWCSSLLAVAGFSYLWGIGEIIEQEERVRKGWYPKKEKKEK